MDMRTILSRGWRPLAGSLVLLGGCADNPAAVLADPPVLGTAVSCSADVRAQTVTCGAPGTAADARLSLLLGGHDRYLRILPSRVAFNPASRTLNVWLAVRNLAAQPLGTEDGGVSAGLRVFVHTGPSVTRGSGRVVLANPDGTARLLSRGRPYVAYPGVVQPDEATPARWWGFRVSPGVEAFEFELLVDAPLPIPEGVLRWVTARAADTEISGAWGAGGDTMFAAAGRYVARSVDGGASWESHRLPGPFLLRIVGLDARTLYAAGYDAGGRSAILRSTGGQWTEWEPVVRHESTIRAVWAAAPSHLYAVADDHAVLRSTDGIHWTRTEFAPDSQAYWRLLTDVWGSGPGDVYVVGFDSRPGHPSGVILHTTDGGATWRERTVVRAEGGARLHAVRGLPGGHVWAVGGRTGAGGSDGLILHSADGGATWTEATVPGATLWGIWASAPSRVYAVGDTPRVFAFNGSAWFSFRTGSPVPGFGAVEGLDDGTVLAFSQDGTVFRAAR